MQEVDAVWTCLLDSQQLSSENVLLGYMKGVRRRGRQPKRWTDSITEWTGLSVSDAVDKFLTAGSWSVVDIRSKPQRSMTMRQRFNAGIVK